MLNKHARNFFTVLFTPLAKFLLALGVTPNAVTIVGTTGVVLAALICFPSGWLFWGVVFVTIFIFSDLVDGIMARIKVKQPGALPEGKGAPHKVSGTETNSAALWGGFLDSTLDRIADAAIFSGIAIWYFTGGENTWIGIAALLGLVTGFIVSYARAKAESLALDADVGVAERGERLVSVLTVTGLVGLGLPDTVLLLTLIMLVAASIFTIGQRINRVWRTLNPQSEKVRGKSGAEHRGLR